VAYLLHQVGLHQVACLLLPAALPAVLPVACPLQHHLGYQVVSVSLANRTDVGAPWGAMASQHVTTMSWQIALRWMAREMHVGTPA
jgi:hypothetical protein